MAEESNDSNALLGAASPYLRQHAHNPVQWYPWGAEALRLAKKQQKPIFLSIGYSTCYWCHVMEREVFADKAMAARMNADFINIKVDREERPDLDEIYMLARQIITREGGWPNNVFLTPDLKPFFAGGTFARDQRYGQPSFTELLKSMAHAWQHKRAEVEAMGMQVTERLKHTLSQGRAGTVQKEVLQASVEKLVHHLKVSHDDVHGGFYTAPKFPHETYLLFLAEYYRFYKDKQARDILLRSLDGMAAGGIYDHVGGGFHRYSVDAHWQVPHFEKMLYNQALLTLCYLEGYALSGKPYYEDVVRKTLDFVAEHMVVSGGGFASAYDAETDAVEGAYYVWSEEELAALLPKRTKAFLDAAYLRVGLPEFPGHAHAQGGVLVARAPLDQIAAKRGMTYDAFQDALDKTLGKLLFRRSNRKTPARDDKVITAWNGMMITAFAQAGMVLGEERYVAIAEKAAAFLLKALRDKRGVVYRIYSKKQRQQRGFLEDYVWLVRALAMLARVTGKESWLVAAIEVVNTADDLLLDGRGGGFFFSEAGKDLLVQIKTADDGAVPAANAVMVQALADLAELTQQTRFAGTVWQERAESTIGAFAGQIADNPAQYVHMLHGQMRFWEAGGKQAVKKKKSAQAALPQVERRKAPRQKAPSKALDSAHYVQVSAALNKKKVAPTDTFKLKVTLKIAEGWHIQPQTTVRKGLVATQVDVRSAHTTVRKVSYPRAQHFVADTVAGTVDVYKDVITIPVTLYLKAAAQPGDIENVRIIVTFQACSETSCLQTATTVVEMPLIVGKRGR